MEEMEEILVNELLREYKVLEHKAMQGLENELDYRRRKELFYYFVAYPLRCISNPKIN